MNRTIAPARAGSAPRRPALLRKVRSLFAGLEGRALLVSKRRSGLLRKLLGGKAPARAMDATWYLRRYPDVAEAGIDPAKHYGADGWSEGRFPNAATEIRSIFASSVDEAWYLDRYPDVAEAGIDPATHYALHGRFEHRFPSAAAQARSIFDRSVDAAWYRGRYPDVIEAGVDPAAHYAARGWAEGRFPDPAAEAAHLSGTGEVQAAVLLLLDVIRTDPRNDAALDELGRIARKWGSIKQGHLLDAVLHDGGDRRGPGPVSVDFEQLTGLLEAGRRDLGPGVDADIALAVEELATDVAALRTIRQAVDAGRRGLVFDVSDLLAHFRHQRLPTGIQRVQIEVVSRFISALGTEARIGAFVSGRSGFVEVSTLMLQDIIVKAGSIQSFSQKDWDRQMAVLFVGLMTAEKFNFRDDDVLMNIGTSWWIPEYFLFVRNARSEHNVKLVQFVHDLIPFVVPEYCVDGLVQEYFEWLGSALHHCDLFLANSRSTASDLRSAAAAFGQTLPERAVEVVSLNSDFRSSSIGEAARDRLRRWNIDKRRYVLLVSTIEPRKNHLLAFKAWERLLEAQGTVEVPLLVCVGRRGWLSDDVFLHLEKHPHLRRYVRMVQNVDDDELALLYRESLLTLYTSHYEGWGLPVTESLCYGKVPVVAANSSLPEAAERFGVFFQSDSTGDLCRALTELLTDETRRQALESAIAADFRPRPWSKVAEQIAQAIGATAAPDARVEDAQHVRLGAYYPLSTLGDTRIRESIANGERYRMGDGWWPSDALGGRTKPDGAALRLRVRGGGRLRVFVRLRGLRRQSSRYVMAINGQAVASGAIEPGASRWALASASVPRDEDTIHIRIRGEGAETITVGSGDDARQVAASISVCGFMICSEADERARTALIEASLAGDYSSLQASPDRSDAIG